MIGHNLGHFIKGTPRGWLAHHGKHAFMMQDDYKHNVRLSNSYNPVIHNYKPIEMIFNQPEWWYQSLLDGKHALDFLNSTIENDANLVSGLRLRRFNFTETNIQLRNLTIDPSFYEIGGEEEE